MTVSNLGPLNCSFSVSNATMYEELWSEIADAPGEIYDLPEFKEFDDQFDDQSFDTLLNTEYDF
jgi:hypothetical protein